MEIYNSPVYRRSRIAYSAQCTFDYLISLLITDAFLAKLLTNIGVSDAVIGIISSFIPKYKYSSDAKEALAPVVDGAIFD